MKIKFKRQKTFPDCINTNKLRFDVYVYFGSSTLRFIIEFDGSQHFQPTKKFGGEARYKTRVESDNIKNKYCIDNNIPILRISYKEMSNIELILKLYLNLIKNNAAPPIMFTNKALYQPMKNEITKCPFDSWFLNFT